MNRVEKKRAIIKNSEISSRGGLDRRPPLHRKIPKERVPSKRYVRKLRTNDHENLRKNKLVEENHLFQEGGE